MRANGTKARPTVSARAGVGADAAVVGVDVGDAKAVNRSKKANPQLPKLRRSSPSARKKHKRLLPPKPLLRNLARVESAADADVGAEVLLQSRRRLRPSRWQPTARR